MKRDSIAEELTFLSVVSTGSFSESASQLGISQSSVSRRVAALEERLGNRTLLDRTTRRVRVTELGRVYARYLRAALSQLGEAEQAVLEWDEEPGGLIRLSLPPALALNRLMPCLNDLLRAHPQLNLEVHLAERYVDLYEDEFDAALRLWSEGKTGLKYITLGPSPLVLVAAPGYVQKHGAVTRRNIGDHAFVNTDNAVNTGPILRTIVRDWDEGSIGHARVRTNHATVIRNLVLEGDLLGILPWLVVARDIDKGDLVHVQAGLKLPHLDAVLAYRHTLEGTPRLAVLAQALKEEIARTPWPGE